MPYTVTVTGDVYTEFNLDVPRCTDAAHLVTIATAWLHRNCNGLSRGECLDLARAADYVWTSRYELDHGRKANIPQLDPDSNKAKTVVQQLLFDK